MMAALALPASTTNASGHPKIPAGTCDTLTYPGDVCAPLFYGSEAVAYVQVVSGGSYGQPKIIQTRRGEIWCFDYVLKFQRDGRWSFRYLDTCVPVAPPDEP